MEDIVQFIESLGGLHDASLLKLSWQPENKLLEIEIDDLHSNERNSLSCKGPTKAYFKIHQVTRLRFEDMELSEKGLMLYDWVFQRECALDYAFEVQFSPGGKIIVECGRIECIANV